MSRFPVNRRTGTSGPWETRIASMRGRLIRSKFQMKASTLGRRRIPCASRGLNARRMTRQIQNSLERSSQSTSVARGNRRSNVATAKLPSLTQSSPACAFSIMARKVGTSFFVQCGCHMSSRQITGAPVIWPSCRAKVVFPTPAQPKMTIRSTQDHYHEGDEVPQRKTHPLVNLSVLCGLRFLPEWKATSPCQGFRARASLRRF